MTHPHRTASLVLTLAAALAVALVGCRRSSAAHHDDHPATAPAPAAAHTSPEAARPAHAMAALDARKPVPLTAMMASHQKQDMRDHLLVIQEVTAALAKEDYDAIAKSAARIGWSEQEAMMCKHMGAGAPGFSELAEHFHHTADTIAAAATRHDRAGVAAALGATLQECVGCHATYRQEIVDQAPAALEAGAASMDEGCPMMQGDEHGHEHGHAHEADAAHAR